MIIFYSMIVKYREEWHFTRHTCVNIMYILVLSRDFCVISAFDIVKNNFTAKEVEKYRRKEHRHESV